jgi:hypothetical protein
MAVAVVVVVVVTIYAASVVAARRLRGVEIQNEHKKNLPYCREDK